MIPLHTTLGCLDISPEGGEGTFKGLHKEEKHGQVTRRGV